LRLRRSGRTCYFGPQPKEGAPWTIEDNPIEISDEERKDMLFRANAWELPFNKFELPSFKGRQLL